MSDDKKYIQINVNNSQVKIEMSVGKTLLDAIRDDLGLTGTKEGCGEGACGACTVLLDNVPVVSCIIPLEKAINKKITTIEGLGSPENLHPLQQKFIEVGAVQCGFCTPGFIMSGVALLRENNNPSEEEIKTAISGNLCRCTGYKKIIEAIKQTDL